MSCKYNYNNQCISEEDCIWKNSFNKCLKYDNKKGKEELDVAIFTNSLKEK